MNHVKYIHLICLPLKAVDLNDTGEVERGEYSQQSVVTGYITGKKIEIICSLFLVIDIIGKPVQAR